MRASSRKLGVGRVAVVELNERLNPCVRIHAPASSRGQLATGREYKWPCGHLSKICYNRVYVWTLYRLPNERELIENRFGARLADALFTPRYNAAPSQSLPVNLNTEPQVIQPLVWGLRPK